MPLRSTRTVPKCAAFLVWAALASCGGDEPAAHDAAGGAGPAEAGAIAAVPGGADAVPGNQPPRIDAVRFDPPHPVAGESVRAVVEAEDPDGDSIWLEYAWELAGERRELGMPRLLLQGASKGDPIQLTVTARDGKATSEPWTAETEIANTPPRIGSVRVEPQTIVAGDPIVVRPEASDADADAIRFTYLWEVNGVGQAERGARFATTDLRRGDRVRVEVRATDGEDESEPRALPELTIANAPPRIVSVPGEPFDGAFYRVRAEDPDGDAALQFELEDPPRGMTIHSATGAIQWEPGADQAGTHAVTVVVDDLQGGRTRQTIEVTVTPPDAAQSPASARRAP